MKKVIAIAAVLCAFGSAQAFAQARNFEGFSVGANVEADSEASNASDGSSGSSSNTGLGLQARYDWALGDRFVLGLGGTISTGNRNAGTFASGATAFTSNRYSIDLTPGYAVSKDLLVFGKLSDINATATGDDGSSTNSTQGIGYGIGVRGMVDHHVFWQAGLDHYRFNDATFNTGTTASLSGNIVSFGVGYKF